MVVISVGTQVGEKQFGKGVGHGALGAAFLAWLLAHLVAKADKSPMRLSKSAPAGVTR